MNCFKCGQPGHIAQNCAWKDELEDPRPIWCGTCDPNTRHVDLGDRVRRCDCHPESHKLLTQHRRCPRCKAIVLKWDNGDCERHLVARQHRPFTPPVPPRGPDHDRLRQLAARQVAEAREERLILDQLPAAPAVPAG